jgi:hypothetical protein
MTQREQGAREALNTRAHKATVCRPGHRSNPKIAPEDLAAAAEATLGKRKAKANASDRHGDGEIRNTQSQGQDCCQEAA